MPSEAWSSAVVLLALGPGLEGDEGLGSTRG